MRSQIKINKRGEKIDASGRIDKLNLIKPYPPNFSKIPARITEPPWEPQHERREAMCEKATLGFLLTKDAKKANHNHTCI